MARTVDIALTVLLIIQAAITVFIWILNPIIVTHQVLAAGYIASSLVILAMITYVYYRGEDYDQEWLAAGVGFIALILFLTYMMGGVA